MPDTGSIISCHDVHKVFIQPAEHVCALNGASFDVPVGSFVALRGASGSGKTTLLNIIAGLDTADTGQVVVLDRDLSELTERERTAFRLDNLGVVFQDNNLIDEFSAAENVMLPLQGLGLAAREARVSAMETLELMGIDELADRHPQEMSGGQRQRVGIARALVGDRRVLLADEPTGALDSANSSDLFAMIARLCSDRMVTAVVATHDPLVEQHCSRQLKVRDGVTAT